MRTRLKCHMKMVVAETLNLSVLLFNFLKLAKIKTILHEAFQSSSNQGPSGREKKKRLAATF